MTATPIRFELEGSVNGTEFTMYGKGEGNRDLGRCHLTLDAEPGFPEGFDPVSCPLICHHMTSHFFASPETPEADFTRFSGKDYQVEPARQGTLWDETGRKVLNLKVDGRIRLTEDGVVSQQQMWGRADLPPLSSIDTPLVDYILPSQPGEATGLARYKILTKSGAALDGLTVVPYRWDNSKVLPGPLVRRVEDIEVDWDGSRHVETTYSIKMRVLDAPDNRFSPVSEQTRLAAPR